MKKISRRTFLLSGIGVTGLALTGMSGNSSHTIIKREHSLVIPELEPEFADYRMGFVSDIHLGRFIREDWMANALSLLKNDRIDLLLIGGDHIDVPPADSHKAQTERRSAGAILERFAHVLQSIQPPDGIIAVSGNHDNWGARGLIVPLFKKHGVSYLVNETHVISRGTAQLEIVGVDDYWTGIPELPKSSAATECPARILLAHNPDYISTVLRTTDYHFSLGLAGHTHGGQICLPGGTPLLTGISDTRFVKGLRYEERAPVLTSCGVGLVGLPYRLHCPAEVHVITLQPA